eukprot:3656698-Karenia_brevis.AAC.1
MHIPNREQGGARRCNVVWCGAGWGVWPRDQESRGPRDPHYGKFTPAVLKARWGIMMRYDRI